MRRKLTTSEHEELVRLYRDEGWHVVHLARKFRIHHKSVQQHIKNVKRNAPQLEYCPQELVERSAQYRGKINRPQFQYTYQEYLEREEQRRLQKKKECDHDAIVIICRCCGTHFEETRHAKAKATIKWL